MSQDGELSAILLEAFQARRELVKDVAAHTMEILGSGGTRESIALRGFAERLDLPHLWSGWMRHTLLSADDVVITAAPDLASLRNAKNLIDLIKRGRPNDAPPQLIINQVGLPGRPEIPVKEFSKALGVEPALVLPFDSKLFGGAANNGQMIFEVNAKAKASEGLGEAMTSLETRKLEESQLLAGRGW